MDASWRACWPPIPPSPWMSSTPAAPCCGFLIAAFGAPAPKPTSAFVCIPPMLSHGIPRGTYDLVVSHFFLDCFFASQLEQLFDRILPHLRPGRAMGDLRVRHSPQRLHCLSRRRPHRLALSRLRSAYRAPCARPPGLRCRTPPPRLRAQSRQALSRWAPVLPGLVATHHSRAKMI